MYRLYLVKELNYRLWLLRGFLATVVGPGGVKKVEISQLAVDDCQTLFFSGLLPHSASIKWYNACVWCDPGQYFA